MRVLVDTSVWSVALRPGRRHPAAGKLRHHIVTGSQVFLLGVILQEVLQGIRDPAECAAVYQDLAAFECLMLSCEDYREAAQLYRTCRAAGLSVGTVDVQIATAAIRHGCQLQSLDEDFRRMAEHCDLELLD